MKSFWLIAGDKKSYKYEFHVGMAYRFHANILETENFQVKSVVHDIPEHGLIFVNP